MDYVRIGTTYYKSVRKPLASGDATEMLVPWSIECIKQDHGKGFLSSIRRYDGFCIVPGHLNYKREIENFYNRYHPLNIKRRKVFRSTPKYKACRGPH